MSNILVVGHTVLDKIYYKGTLQEKPGGIFHVINTLVNIYEDWSKIHLVTHLAKNSYIHFSDCYDKINLEFSEWVENIPTVTLNLYDNKERDEKYSRINKNITLSTEIDFTRYDIVLINMVSGFDFVNEDLAMIKSKSKCPIYFDLHTLSRGIDENGTRNFRKIPEIESWLANVDILQMNENEMFSLWGIKSEDENINKLLECSVEKVIITKGNKGVTFYNSGKKSKVKAINIEASNFVGCGDSFGAAFCFAYSQNKNINSALEFANLVAGIITTFNTVIEYKKLGNEIAKRTN